MTELITLKEMQHVGFICKASIKGLPEGNSLSMDDGVSFNELRAEAFKWVKQIEHAIQNNGEGMPAAFIPYDHIEDWRGQCLAVQTFIKHFFNISEEELK